MFSLWGDILLNKYTVFSIDHNNTIIIALLIGFLAKCKGPGLLTKNNNSERVIQEERGLVRPHLHDVIQSSKLDWIIIQRWYMRHETLFDYTYSNEESPGRSKDLRLVFVEGGFQQNPYKIEGKF